jgi:hypothetical protein
MPPEPAAINPQRVPKRPGNENAVNPADIARPTSIPFTTTVEGE